MGIVLVIHSTLSNTIWLFFMALGLWGLFNAVRKKGVDSGYLGAMVIGEILYALQAVLGVVLWVGGHLPALGNPTMHILYGSFALVFMPFVYFVWLKGDDSVQAQWVLGLTTLFLFGIALRAVAVAA